MPPRADGEADPLPVTLPIVAAPARAEGWRRRLAARWAGSALAARMDLEREVMGWLFYVGVAALFVVPVALIALLGWALHIPMR